MLLDGLGRRDEAKPMYEEVLRAQPDQPVALNNLAYLKAEEGSDLDTAMSYARKARSSYPQDSNIADTLGWIYIKKNLSDDAIRIYREITSREPNNPVYRYHLAMALLQKGDRQSAKKELETAMKNGPTAADQQKIQALMVKVGL
jgi:Flp pilus assembly protein TadD